jgi:hypothetical protein
MFEKLPKVGSICETVSGGSSEVPTGISKEDTTPLLVMVPGLTSDSASPVSAYYPEFLQFVSSFVVASAYLPCCSWIIVCLLI